MTLAECFCQHEQCDPHSHQRLGDSAAWMCFAHEHAANHQKANDDSIKVVWSDEDGQHRGRVVDFVVRDAFGGSTVQAIVIESTGAFGVLDLSQLQEES